jgi:hypothetical protein
MQALRPISRTSISFMTCSLAGIPDPAPNP